MKTIMEEVMCTAEPTSIVRAFGCMSEWLDGGTIKKYTTQEDMPVLSYFDIASIKQNYLVFGEYDNPKGARVDVDDITAVHIGEYLGYSSIIFTMRNLDKWFVVQCRNRDADADDSRPGIEIGVDDVISKLATAPMIKVHHSHRYLSSEVYYAAHFCYDSDKNLDWEKSIPREISFVFETRKKPKSRCTIDLSEDLKYYLFECNLCDSCKVIRINRKATMVMYESIQLTILCQKCAGKHSNK